MAVSLGAPVLVFAAARQFVTRSIDPLSTGLAWRPDLPSAAFEITPLLTSLTGNCRFGEKSASVSPFAATLTDTPSAKSFRYHSYVKRGWVGGPLPFSILEFVGGKTKSWHIPSRLRARSQRYLTAEGAAPGQRRKEERKKPHP